MEHITDILADLQYINLTLKVPRLSTSPLVAGK